MAKYGRAASKGVETAMRRRKKGTLKSGSGRTVRSRKQAIAIGLNEARERGAKVPAAGAKERSAKKRTAKKRAAKRMTKRTASKAAGRKTTARKTNRARKGAKRARKSTRRS